MFAPERRQYILEAITRHGRVEVAALAQSLQVSEDTVRRDLKALTEQGFLQKTHGGAVLLATAQIPFPTRHQIRPQVKACIAATAAALVQSGQVVFIDAGSTALEVARALAVPGLTVITQSLDVAVVLADRTDLNLVLCGGAWCAAERYFTGPSALAAVAAYRADWAFIGACAVHATMGVTANGADDALVKAAMIQHAAQAVLLADASKFDQIAPHAVADLEQFAHVVTDAPPDWLPSAQVIFVPASDI